MRQTSTVGRVAGTLLAAGGILFFVGGVMHPHSTDLSPRLSVVEMLHSPLWKYAHWLAFVSVVLIILALWLLLDEAWTKESVVASVGSRLTIIGGLFMLVEFAVELAAQGAMPALAAGGGASIFNLFAIMHAAGWPTIAAGFIVLALGVPHVAPLPIRILGVIGALAMGLAGVLVAGFFLTQFGWLFMGGALLAIWITWAGVQTARGAVRHEIPATEAVSAIR